MKKLFIALAFGLLVGLAAYLYIARPCFAGWCGTLSCSKSSDCYSGCVCVDVPDRVSGKCVEAEN